MSSRDRRRQGSSRVVGLHDDDGSFDRDFWRQIFHSQPRFTKALDVWIDPTPSNAGSVFAALETFGA